MEFIAHFAAGAIVGLILGLALRGPRRTPDEDYYRRCASQWWIEREHYRLLAEELQEAIEYGETWKLRSYDDAG